MNRGGRALPVAGALLLAGVVAWRLGAASFERDVTTICDAEGRSRFTLGRDMAALTEWVRSRLTTPRGSALYASLRDLPVDERAARLRAVSPRCPMADAYDELVADGRYRADVAHLCSRFELGTVDELDANLRLQLLEEWIAANATSPRTTELGDALGQAAAGADRAGVLAAAARALGVLSCDTARTLERPPPAAAEIWPGSRP